MRISLFMLVLFLILGCNSQPCNDIPYTFNSYDEKFKKYRFIWKLLFTKYQREISAKNLITMLKTKTTKINIIHQEQNEPNFYNYDNT